MGALLLLLAAVVHVDQRPVGPDLMVEAAKGGPRFREQNGLVSVWAHLVNLGISCHQE